jgi:tetratricopeptide (TPR) repeat protein
LLQALVVAAPSHTVYRFELGQSYGQIADAYASRGDGIQALYHGEKAIEELTPLVKLNPYEPIWNSTLARGYQRLASVWSSLFGSDSEALKKELLVFAIFQRLATHDPSDVRWQKGLVNSDINLASYFDSDHWDDARQCLRHAQAITQKQHSANPEDVEWWKNWVWIHDRLGKLWMSQKRWDLALPEWELGLEWANKLVELDPSNRQWLRLKLNLQTSVGSGNWILGNKDKALQGFAEALASSKNLAATAPADDFEAYKDLGWAYTMLGFIQTLANNPQAAAQNFHAALLVSHQFLTREEPNGFTALLLDSFVIGTIGNQLLKPLQEKTNLEGLVLTDWQRMALQDFFAALDHVNQWRTQNGFALMRFDQLERFRSWVEVVKPSIAASSPG